jgi:hypothetical protein
VDTQLASNSTFGDLTATGSTISAPSNADLTLTTAGTGAVVIDGISISGTTLSSADSSQININENVNVDGNLTVTGTLSGDGSGLTGINVSTNIQIVGDDSTGAILGTGETFKIAGTQNITTAVSGDTLTITGPDLTSYITASSTDTLTNKTFDANGTGNSITNIEVADFAGSAIINVAETLAGNDSDTALVTAGAIIDYVDAQDANIASDTLTFTNKTFDANGTGNSLSNVEVADLASGVLDTDISSASASDDTLASAKAIKTYVDAQISAVSTTSISEGNSSVDVDDGAGGAGQVVINIDGNNELVINDTSATFSGNVIMSGNLTVNGTTTTVATTNTTIEDNIIELNSGISASSNDAGILIERGSTGDNAFIGWDESADKFTVGTTTATAGDKSGGITVTTGTLVANLEATTATVGGSNVTTTDNTQTLTNKTINSASNTITITESNISDLGSYITASSTDTLTNKTFDANGTGNSITNIEVADFAGPAIINVSETLASNDSDTALVTAGAIIDYVDAQDANIASDTLTFTNKTFDANGTGNSISNIETADFASAAFKDEDNMASDSATAVASQQSIKAYVDAETANVASDTLTFTNKTFDANGTGNSITNIEVADFAGTAIINVAETLASNDSDTALVTAGAIIDYVDAQDANIGSDTLTFTNKTFDANGTGNSISNIEVADFASGVLDTDISSASASDDTIASAKAIKTYVDSQVTAQDLDFQADSGGALAIDLDSETLTFTGGTGIDTTGSGNAVTFAIDSTVATLTGSQTLTNKTLTSPVLNTGVSGTAVLDEDNMASDSATQLATQQSIKAYVDTQVGAVSTSSISQGNSDVTVTDSGTGSITIDADGVTIITMNATTVLDASATTNAVRLPNGTTAQRPSGSVGMIRYNSSTDTIEGYTTAGGWAQLGATTATAENTSDTSTGSATAISTTASVIDQFVTSSFDSAWYLAVTRDEINDEVSTAKYSLVHNDTDAFVAESHITQSNVSNTYVTVTADVAGGNARLLGTGGSVVNSVSFYRIATGDNTSAGTTGNVTTAINLDVDSAAEKIDGFVLASARGAKYYISVNNTTTGEISNTEALVVHDGSNAYISQYGNVNTGNNDLITLTTEIDSTEVILKASAQAPNCRVTVYRILLADDESSSTGDNANVIEATTVDSGATTVDSFATSAYTGAFYVFTGYNATEGAASIQEVMVLANDEAYITQGPIVNSKGTDQLTFTASLSGTNVTVQAASTSGSSTIVNGYRVHMLRGSAGASTADTVLVSTEQTITGAKTFTSPIALTVGSDPTGVADRAHIYAKDEASSAEVYVRDEAGNVTKISPHNEAGEWEYYSRNTRTGKIVRVNMEEMIRDIEKLTGKTYIKNN